MLGTQDFPRHGHLAKALPNALTIVLKEEGPDSFLKTYDGESETPELIWDSEMRGELRVEHAEKLDECFTIFETESSSYRIYELPAGEKDLDACRRVDKVALRMIMGGAGGELKDKFQEVFQDLASYCGVSGYFY